MSVNDVPRNSFEGMNKTSNLPPEYSSLNYGGTSTDPYSPSVVTTQEVQERNPPPAYDDIFKRTHTPRASPSYSTRPAVQGSYYKDDRNLCEKLDEWFELSVLQQIIWMGVLAFSISYIYYGVKYEGECIKKRYTNKGKTEDEDDLTSFIQVEGGLLCATVLFFTLLRLLEFCDIRSTKRKTKSKLEEQKKCDGLLFMLCLGLCIANFGVCVAGGTKILPLYDYENNTMVNCSPAFYDFYHTAKIAQLCVFCPYAAYVIFGLFFMVNVQKHWFLRRKLRQWARLLDADQDGIISNEDMKRTNEKLERLRQLTGARRSALSESAQENWWNNHVFKRGPGKDISVDDYLSHMLGVVGMSSPGDMANKVRPMIKDWFNFFTTEDYLKKNLIMGEQDFVRFWSILVDVDESYSKQMYIKHFPSPLTMALFLEDFVSFVSNPEFYDEYSNRIYNVIKFRPPDMCCKA